MGGVDAVENLGRRGPVQSRMRSAVGEIEERMLRPLLALLDVQRRCKALVKQAFKCPPMALDNRYRANLPNSSQPLFGASILDSVAEYLRGKLTPLIGHQVGRGTMTSDYTREQLARTR